MNAQGEPRPSDIKILPPDYNPNVDGGQAAWELFEHWMIRPDEVYLRRNEYGESVVFAFGGHPIVI